MRSFKLVEETVQLDGDILMECLMMSVSTTAPFPNQKYNSFIQMLTVTELMTVLIIAPAYPIQARKMLTATVLAMPATLA